MVIGAVMLWLLAVAPVCAQQNEAGCKDHPLFTRPLNMHTIGCQSRQCDLSTFPAGAADQDGQTRPVEEADQEVSTRPLFQRAGPIIPSACAQPAPFCR
jgi:hypothetical protein